MKAFTIEFVNFGVFVHHRSGLTVVLGETGHALKYHAPSGESGRIPKDADLRLVAARNGTLLNGGPTRSLTGSYMLDLRWMLNNEAAVPSDKVIGSDRAGQNGRVHLHGGMLMDLPAGSANDSHALAEALWDFTPAGAPAPGLHRMTNRAVFIHEIADGVAYHLELGDGGKIMLDAGAAVTIENEDTAEHLEDCAKFPNTMVGGQDRELTALLPAVGIQLQGPPVLRFVRPVVTGLGKICQPCAVVETRTDF